MNLQDVIYKATNDNGGHSIFAPSSSAMWLRCAGSLIPNVLADDHGSVEAAEGTVAHSVAETWLKKGRKAAARLVGQTRTVDGWTIEITEEMLGFVGNYVQWCQEVEVGAVEYWTETRVDFSDLTPIPNQGGTADHGAVVSLGGGQFELVVTDLKYGKGVRVYAEGNTQARLYGYGFYRWLCHRYLFVQVRLRIAHPRLAEGFTETVISISELENWAENVVKPAALKAWNFDADRTPSEAACLWCKVKHDCPALYKHLAEVTSGVFDDDEETYTREEQKCAAEDVEDELGDAPFKPADPIRLSTKALAKILRYRSMMEKFFGAVEAELLTRAISGEEEIPGWKLVEGRTVRRWPENIVPVYKKLKALGLSDEAIFNEVMISPAQAEEKIVAKAGLKKDAAAKIVNALAVKPPGQKSLVRVSDNRKALASDASVFDDDD